LDGKKERKKQKETKKKEHCTKVSYSMELNLTKRMEEKYMSVKAKTAGNYTRKMEEQ
jgi:hypothetical protein